MTGVLSLAGIGIGCYAAGIMGGKLFDNGLANSLCVESLRHGTNLGSYISIRLSGGRSGLGRLGSTEGNRIDGQSYSHFYVFKDTEYNHFNKAKTIGQPIVRKIGYFFAKWVAPRYHAFLSGYNTINGIFCLEHDSENRAVKVMRVFLGTIAGVITLLVTPILKFRFAKIDPARFSDDERYSEMAYKTRVKVEAWRVGIVGSLLTGVNCNWCERVQERPVQFAIGILQVITSAGVLAIPIYFALHAGYPIALFIAPCAVGFALS